MVLINAKVAKRGDDYWLDVEVEDGGVIASLNLSDLEPLWFRETFEAWAKEQIERAEQLPYHRNDDSPSK
jgi:hypothetical protein